MLDKAIEIKYLNEGTRGMIKNIPASDRGGVRDKDGKTLSPNVFEELADKYIRTFIEDEVPTETTYFREERKEEREGRCEICDGSGSVEEEIDDEIEDVVCDDCDGSGFCEPAFKNEDW